MRSSTSTPQDLSPYSTQNLPETFPTTSIESQSHLLALPTELHRLILPHLTYPDLLALRHSHPYFYNIVTTTVPHRLNWLIERAEQGLPLPQKTCRWKTDADFCSSAEVKEFMKRRRRHMDCASEFGVRKCLVVEGSRCPGPRIGHQRKWRSMTAVDVMFRRNEPGHQPELLTEIRTLIEHWPCVTAVIVLIYAVVVLSFRHQQPWVSACSVHLRVR